jgi:hypothetical protein
MEYNLVMALGGMRQDHVGRSCQTFFLDHGYGTKPVFGIPRMFNPATISLPSEETSILLRNVRDYVDYNGCDGCLGRSNLSKYKLCCVGLTSAAHVIVVTGCWGL